MLVRVSELDQILWYRKLEDLSAEDVAARLRGEEGPNRAMQIGTAWHAILEQPPGDVIEDVEQDGFRFIVDCDAEVTLPHIREIRAEKTYRVDGIDVTLTGGTDGITGNIVTDHKVTSRPDAEKYFDSYQWRAYLDIYEADVFEYHLWQAKDEWEQIRIQGMHPFRLYRYPGMATDVVAGIRDFLDFARIYLPERFEEAA